MTTHNDDAVREVTRQQRAERRNKTSTPRNDKPTKADLTREELHLMIEELRKENYRLRTDLREALRLTELKDRQWTDADASSLCNLLTRNENQHGH